MTKKCTANRDGRQEGAGGGAGRGGVPVDRDRVDVGARSFQGGGRVIMIVQALLTLSPALEIEQIISCLPSVTVTILSLCLR